MTFRHHTVLHLTIEACTTLPDIKIAEIERDASDDMRQKAERDRNNAKSEEKKAWQNLHLLGPEPFPVTEAYNSELNRLKKIFVAASKTFEEAEEIYQQFTADEDGRKETTRPNAFVTVTLDEDNQDISPIVFTHTYRADKRPFWHESYDNIPIGLLAHGKWATQLLSGSRSPYCPARLNFWIYHDIGSDKGSEDVWKRPTPKRDLLIGRASLNFGTLVCDGCESWHEITVVDGFENPLQSGDCTLRVKTQMSTSSPDAVLLTKPMDLPGGVVCGRPATEDCKCGGGCGKEKDNIEMHIPMPSHKHKHMASKPKKKRHCKKKHVHYE